MRPDAEWRADAHALRPEIRGVLEHRGRKHAVLDAALIVIEIVDEEVQRPHPLHQAPFDLVPLAFANDPGDEIQRPAAIDGALFLGIHRESDAHFLDRELKGPAAGLQLLLAHAR